MIFFVYSIVYFLSLFLAVWLALFLIRNRDGSELHRYMILASITSFAWFIADFFTFINFRDLDIYLIVWRISFAASWSLIISISLLLLSYTKKLNIYGKTFLSFLYLFFFYIILFINFILPKAKTLTFPGDSSYYIGSAFIYLAVTMVAILLFDFYLILRAYLGSKNDREKSINKIILRAVFLVVLLPTVSNLILPSLGISFPRLAALSVGIFLLTVIYLIYKYAAFNIKDRIFDINTKVSLSIILVSLIPILLISAGFYSDARDILEKEELKNEEHEISIRETFIDAFLNTSKQDLFFLVNSSNFQGFINSEQGDQLENYKKDVVIDFSQFSKNRNIYHQIRYIDKNGQEQIRVDNVNGVVENIPQDRLQNKADRYYFYEAIDLDPGTIYISPLDLNVENGEVEKPYNPMIRYATPVFDRGGNNVGIIILNIKVGDMLQYIRTIEGPYTSIYMVNSDGYYLVHPDRNKEWGFMLDQEENNIFKDDSGIAQEIFSPKDLFQISCPNEECYINSKRIYLDKNVYFYLMDDHAESFQIDNQEEYWIVYSKVDKGALTSLLNSSLYDIYVLIFIIFIILVLISLFFSRALVRPIYKLKEGIDIITQGDFEHRVNITSDDEIGDLSLSFNQMTEAIQDSRKEIDKKVKLQTKEIVNKSKELEDQQSAILNVLEDVEEEKEKTALVARDLEKFKLAVENAYSHIVITDSEGICLYANGSVERITGFSIKEVLGKKVGTKENWGGLMSDDFYHKLWRTIKIEKKAFSGEVKNKRKNGEEYDSFAIISPVLDEHGHVKFFVGIERDISKEKQIDRAKSEFVSLASHQLRTPLSTINWYTEILLAEDAGKLNDEQKDYLKEVYKGNQRMVDLVNALLNVSRIELGTLAVEPEETDLIDLAESVLNEIKPQVSKRKQKIVKNFGKNIPKIVLDLKLMRIVFQNYISNAIKYTPEKGQIELTMKKQKNKVLISVKDNGIGIPKRQQEKIFQKLFRADNVRERETDGTGLGLYIVKSVVEQFGGKVWFESVENKGTTFYATIPLEGVKAKEGTRGLEYTK